MLDTADLYLTEVWMMCLLGTFTTFVSLVLCVCGCRRGIPKNDLLGLDGMMKITNPDENVNHLPAIGKYVPEDDNATDTNNKSKRYPATGNPHRSLPDIPFSAAGEVKVIDNGVIGDTSSELYATVEDKGQSAATKQGTFAPSERNSQFLSISQPENNYTSVKENPYAKVKKNENPYTKIQGSSTEETSTPPDSNHRNEDIAVESTSDFVEHVDDEFQESSDIHIASTSEIAAATAVAGIVAASQELPYMTPPIQPQHFSGDSQDSFKGYTSISVREPLANIKKTSFVQNKRSELDPHYSTVSDDSDEMYAAIVDPNQQIYTSGSETYAQIQPINVIDVLVHPVASGAELQDDQYESVPQPPSVDSLKHVAHVHSRQASSSSCTSSVANLGSPKPEKRQANSPLPPPPLSISPDIYNYFDKYEDNDPLLKKLEDMYAKVNKNKRKSDDEKDPSVIESCSAVAQSSKDTHNELKTETPSKFDGSSPDQRLAKHCYESLHKKDRGRSGSLVGSDPDYEQVHHLSSNDPNYEELNQERKSNYATVQKELFADSLSEKSESDHNYESVKYLNVSYTEPAYESLDNKFREQFSGEETNSDALKHKVASDKSGTNEDVDVSEDELMYFQV